MISGLTFATTAIPTTNFVAGFFSKCGTYIADALRGKWLLGMIDVKDIG